MVVSHTESSRRIEAALVVIVPEAEPLVARFRAKYDPAAGWGVPAHITINYPFILGVNPSADVMRRLSKLFAKIASFSFTARSYRQISEGFVSCAGTRFPVYPTN